MRRYDAAHRWHLARVRPRRRFQPAVMADPCETFFHSEPYSTVRAQGWVMELRLIHIDGKSQRCTNQHRLWWASTHKSRHSEKLEQRGRGGCSNVCPTRHPERSSSGDFRQPVVPV